MVSGSVDKLGVNYPPTSATPTVLPDVTSTKRGAASGLVKKESIAIKVWLGLVVVVLFALWCEMQTPVQNLNFIVEGNSDAVGADVRIDGQSVGKLDRVDQANVKMIALRCKLADGQHTIEVLKPGFAPFKQVLNMHNEDYINVKLAAQ